MREDLLIELEAEYAAQREANERTERARREEIREKYPEIDRLAAERENMIHGLIRGILNHESGKDSPSDRMETMNRRIRELLRGAGLPEDYLAPVYRCSVCSDTGYAGYPLKQPCACLKEAYLKKVRERIGLSGGQDERFETFDLDLIPDTPPEGQTATQRQITDRIRTQCEKWASLYPDVPYRDILLSGPSGLGKTFLMHAMANRLLERGINVLPVSAYQFLQTARESYFRGDGGMDELMRVPVLMVDDLGSEPLMNNITVELLFNLINERQSARRSTVISTNLSLMEFRERYTERIMSRLNDPRKCLVFTLKGQDLRRVRRNPS